MVLCLAFAISHADVPARLVTENGEVKQIPARVRTQYAGVLGFNETAYDMSGNAVSGIAYVQIENVKREPSPEVTDDETLKQDASAKKAK